MQGTWVGSLVSELGQRAKTPHAAKQLSPCATATELELRSQGTTTTEARTPGASAPREKPRQ